MVRTLEISEEKEQIED